MKEKIYIKKNKLVLEIPLFKERANMYDNYSKGEPMYNIIGLIYHTNEFGDPEIGFSYNIDMSYKGKADQESDFFFKYYDGEEKFRELCGKLRIELREYFK